MTEIVQVPFHGAFLHTALGEDGEPVVILKPTIKAMGLDWAAQHTKLQRRSWGVVGQTPTTGADGKTYEMVSCGLDTWSMLLANIDENKVKEAVRPLVIKYQKESAQRLRDYWTTGMAINPAVADKLPVPAGLPQDYEEALSALLVKVRREKALEADNEKLTARAEIAERKFEEFEGGPGITLTKFHKKYFSEVPARVFFEHLYSRGYLIDQRGQGPWDEKRQCYKDGPQHFEPGFKGKQFLYLHEAGIFRKKRRFKTLVRPGDPELNFKHRLVADGLRGNAHTTDYLFAIEGGR